MKLVSMTAWATEYAALTHVEAAELARSGLVDVSVEPQSGEWRLRSSSLGGIAVGEGCELRVRPKIDVQKLMFLLGYARDPSGWGRDRADFAYETELFDVVAHAFAHQASVAIERGILRGYVHLEDRLMTLRGRILFERQMARGGRPIPADVAYDDYTVDIRENQLLRTAATLLLRLPRVPSATRSRLRGIRGALDEVSHISRPREARAPALTRLNARYGPAMKLAELVLRSSSIDTDVGEVAGTAFIFDMNTVFEDFLTTALTETLAGVGGHVKAQHIEMLDLQGGIRIQPDITWWRNGFCVAVVDAKYKSLTTGGVRNPDAYQMLAYCTAMRLPVGFLVYAKESGEQAGRHDIRNSVCEIRVRTLDLEGSPESLLLRVSELADEIVASGSPIQAAA